MSPTGKSGVSALASTLVNPFRPSHYMLICCLCVVFRIALCSRIYVKQAYI